jgi:PPIC-type PPIASE domain
MDDSRLRAWLREPLLHFLAAGAAIFLVYRVVSGGDEGPREIVVSESRIEALAEGFARTWMRPPTAKEIRGLVDDYVREEIYYREAMALGLDRDDTVIRRRLRQKMEFISDDVASAREPTESELQSYLEENSAVFVDPPTLSFQQRLFSSDRRGDAALEDARQALGQLNAGDGVPAASMGDPTLLPAEMAEVTPREVADLFGEAFAAEVEDAQVDRWIGPVQSPFGVHVVRLSSRKAGRLPTLAEIRPAVLREWQANRQEDVNEAFYRGLLTKYDVRIDGEIGQLLRRQAARGEPVASDDGG